MWSDLTGSATTVSVPVPAVSVNINDKNTDIALATARLGYTANNWLFYVKGGGAWGQGSGTAQVLVNGAYQVGVSQSVNRTGWTIGAGIEWGFFNNWSVKIEYNHVDFGTQSATDVPTSGPTSTVNLRDTVDIVKAGLNYRFNITGMP
jgi:outer membrane immunogenic protein